MYSTGCLICGKELEYTDSARTIKCHLCGEVYETNSCCADEHFVCDNCHSRPGEARITGYALSSKSKNPVTIATEMMGEESINMHGPEHHYLITAALLTAYKNSGGEIDLKKALLTAKQRSGNVPGGVCGMWGSCGAGIGAGIFISIITGATPLSKTEWGQANLATAKSLFDIAQNGGPRCCKRNVWLSILSVIDFTKEVTNISMEKPEKIQCHYFTKNMTCKKENCLFFPKSSPI